MKNSQNSIKITGEITMTKHAEAKGVFKLWNKLIRGLYSIKILSRKGLMGLYIRGKKLEETKDYNIICTTGFAVLAKILVGDYLSTGEITKMALGTGVGTPAITDIALFTEAYRNNTASSTSSGGIAILTAFYTEIEVDGTFTEFGNFIDDTELFSHINVNWVKTNLETLTVQCKYTFVNKP